MMPQTVPNRPTKGAVEPIVGEHAGSPGDPPAGLRLDARRREATRSFRPSAETARALRRRGRHLRPRPAQRRHPTGRWPIS